MDTCLLFLVTLFLFVLAKHCGNGFDGLLKLYLSIVAGWQLVFTKLGLSARSESVILVGGEAALILTNVVGVLFIVRVLGK